MKNTPEIDVTIIGGGLAGLTSALHLSNNGLRIVLVEKHNYPKHKVCGEYISNEILPYLDSLSFDPFQFGAHRINRFLLSTKNSKTVETKLPLGGFGLSRYTLDGELVKRVKANGVEVVQDSVIDIVFKKSSFLVSTKENNKFRSRLVIGAFGKRSNLDVKLKRPFIKKTSPYLAVKFHATGEFPDHLVALHNFNSGYCGVSKVENNVINICYLTNYDSFKKFKSINDFQEQVLFENNFLRDVFESTTSIFAKPLTISQVSFATKQTIADHIIMCGDTAGMIHPLCGNGMSMAMHSAQIASELIIDYFNGKLTDRVELERSYMKAWRKEFNGRLSTGHLLAKLFKMNYFSDIMLMSLQSFPSLLPKIIRRTHGTMLVAS